MTPDEEVLARSRMREAACRQLGYPHPDARHGLDFARFIWACHPFFLTHGLMHTTMIVQNFTRERIPSEEKDDPCVF
ncbi:hypothetical protein PVAP13_4KG057000 [Panicum virgatum]|uniref:Uncharacterized protein n=1 Tax=Panicum virgatum TaxID=38727 RepID=A0A8T0TJV2_PANVG|nr:hypothetical protein PVAP13_4KG057000 [Panicum virgatum]